MAADPDIFGDYDVETFFDEIIDESGDTRAHYTSLVARLAALGPEELARRQRLKDRIFRTQGITFTVYGDDGGTERAFPLDLIPRIIPADEWSTVDRGLRQRVHALNLFLEDLYVGEQQVLADGIVPRELVESSEGYVAEARGIPAPHAARCVVAGIDLVRDDRGNYVVLEDNVRCPSGISYVVENRATMTRVLPVAFRAAPVRPVNQYPNLLLNALQSVAPPHVSEPTVVLLTPGMYNSAYFEHAFLARNMGIELVEGRDLEVDERRVWMRTTRGRRKVDVIYRRVDDSFMDPAVFRADSALGVTGVVDVARAGNVTLANALGNGVADDKAVYPYVPDLIRYYLGEDPVLANVETYRLDDPDQLEAVLARLDQLVVKPAAGSGGYGILIGPSATDAELADFAAKVRADPRGFIAQEVVSLSRHATLTDGTLEGRHIDLRPFVVTGETTDVIPGGLTRVALERGSLVVNSSQGGGSKDTWVLAPPDAPGGSLDTPPLRQRPPREEVVLARVASSLFWAGRYLERSGDTGRLLNVAFHGHLEGHAEPAAAQWADLLDVLLLRSDYDATGQPYGPDHVAPFLVSDRSNPGSLISSINAARENIRGIREKVSVELWQAINDLYLDIGARDLHADLEMHPYQLFDRVVQGCQLVAGVIDETMSHNDGWRFLTLGRTIERGLVSVRLLDVHFAKLLSESKAIAFHHWVSVLRSAGALQEYRKVFQTSVDPGDAISFLLDSRDFPRSVLRCLISAEEALLAVGGPRQGIESRRAVGSLRATVEFCPVDNLLYEGLRDFLDGVSAGLEDLSTTVTAEFFPDLG